MTHYSRLFALSLTLSVPIACDKAVDDQVKTTGAQVKAANEINAANEKAAEEDRAAKASEEKTIAAADANFAKLRADYRTETQTRLGDLDRKVTALDKRSTAGVDARLAAIHTQRTQFDTDFAALGSATESTWDAQKAALDKKLSDMNALADQSNPAGWDHRTY
jgi:hypothetical protein